MMQGAARARLQVGIAVHIYKTFPLHKKNVLTSENFPRQCVINTPPTILRLIGDN
jgi:hypothetical protein